MTSYDTLFQTLAETFEARLGLPANFFLVQNQTVAANLAQSSSSQPYGRLWIDNLESDSTVSASFEAIVGDDQNVLKVLHAPQDFELTVHFYRAGARDLAKQLTRNIWDYTDEFNAIRLTVIDTTGVQNVPEIVQQQYSDHAVLRVQMHFIDEESFTVQAITQTGAIGINYQNVDGTSLPVVTG